MITTLNPRVTQALAIISLIVAALAAVQNKYSVATFVVGAIASFPLTMKSWEVIEKNWKTLYKKFYSRSFYKREKRFAVQSIRLTWWTIPCGLVVYSTISFAIIRFSSDFGLLLSLTAGSIFVTALVSSKKSPKYYKEVAKNG